LHTTSARILIVEDDRSTALLQRRRLELSGHRVTTVSTPVAAENSIAQFPVDLMFLDYFLGDSATGLELYDRLKSQGHDIPTILVTAISDDAVIIQALRAGVRDFVTKSPDYLDYLPEAAANVLQQVSIERRLAESEGRLAGIVNSAMDAILTVESDLRIGVFNAAAEEVFGCPAADAIGRPVNNFIPGIPPPATRTDGTDWWTQRCVGAPAVVRGELVGRRTCGEKFPLEVSVSKVKIASGSTFFTLILRDITEQKRAEEALRIAHADLERHAAELARSNEQLVRSNQELDEFAYVASHDLKEPLRGISNYASFIMEDYRDKLDDDGRAKLQTLQNLSSRLEALIDSILEFSRVSRVDMAIQETDLNRAVLEVLDSLRISLDQRNVSVRIPRPLPTVRCDHVRIAEVFRNLITNAMKYNDKDTKWIEIGYLEQSRDPDATGRPAAGGSKSRKSYVFYVRDNGIGIPPKHAETVFRIFKRLHGRDRFGGGTGVGLSIVKKIIERHAGRIWIESEVGQLTTFYFALS
jgi:PAS domain S-box-containing protein